MDDVALAGDRKYKENLQHNVLYQPVCGSGNWMTPWKKNLDQILPQMTVKPDSFTSKPCNIKIRYVILIDIMKEK